MLRHVMAAVVAAGTLLALGAGADAQPYYRDYAYQPPRSSMGEMNRDFQSWWDHHIPFFDSHHDRYSYEQRRRDEYAHWNWCRYHPYAQGCGDYR